MARRRGTRHGTRRGAHRSEPEDAGTLRRLGGLLESTVPKRVEPPRLLNVLVISGVILGLLLFGYSTTQIYLQFGNAPEGTQVPGAQEDMAPSHDATQKPERDATGEDDGPQTQAGTESTTVVHEIVETHEAGFTGSITVTNTSQNPLEAWELVLAFDNAEIVDVEGADWEPVEDGVLVRRPDGRTGPAPGDSMSLTFHALGNPESPMRCLLNGQDCNL